MLDTQKRPLRKAVAAIAFVLSSLFLSGCYEAVTYISVGGESAASAEVEISNSAVVSRDAWVHFAGYWYGRETGNRELDNRNYYGGLELSRELDIYIHCQGLESDGTVGGYNPYNKFAYYTGNGSPANKAKQSLGRGVRYQTSFSDKATSLTCKAQTGGYRLSTDGEVVVLSGAVAIPDITGWSENYFVGLEWEDGWDLVETNGFRTPAENQVKWKGNGGSRIEMNAVLRKLGDGELPLQRISSPIVLDGLNEDLLPVGPEEPDFSAGVSAAADSIEGQEAPEGYEVLLNGDGTVALVEQSSAAGTSWINEALVYGAWMLLGAGVLSGLLVGGIAIGRRAGQ